MAEVGVPAQRAFAQFILYSRVYGYVGGGGFGAFKRCLRSVSQGRKQTGIFRSFLRVVIYYLSVKHGRRLCFGAVGPCGERRLGLFSRTFTSLVMRVSGTPLASPFKSCFRRFLDGSEGKRFFAPVNIYSLVARLAATVRPKSGGERKSGEVCSPTYNDNELLLSTTGRSEGRFFMNTSVSCAYYLVAVVGLYLGSLGKRVFRVGAVSGRY